MELKGYQKEVIGDLKAFIKHVELTPQLDTAFNNFWKERGVDIGLMGNEYLHPYQNTIPGVPNVTVKVPTAGGKTLIACASLPTLFENCPEGKPKVVAWFVPSDTILKQTIRNLKNTSHPYRQKIDSMFGSRVCVVDKESALMGQGISPAAVMEQLTIFVLSVQSFATNNKEGRRSYRENANLADYTKLYDSLTKNVEGADETSLIQVISYLNPVVIIDESHNFTANLRVDALTSINPSFILNLTATPKPNSNIISFVDAIKLKRAHMVKLPVIVYNHKSVEDVIISAIQMQRTLEKKALLERQKNEGTYIRPIVLFQAQPRTGQESITYEKIKTNLIELGIPEDQIKIKTGEKDELNKVNLLSEECPVRFIITVDALKEGWDCPFAYILASLANRTSKISVEQILGRILRLPYTKNHEQELLNLSYVFASSRDFQDTINSIITSLNNAGFSRKDYRTEEELELSADTPIEPEVNVFTSLFGDDEDESGETSDSDIEAGEIDTARVKDALGDTLSTPPTIEEANRDDTQPDSSPTSAIEDIALQKNKDYEEQNSSSSDNDSDLPNDLMNLLPAGGSIKDFLQADAATVELPRFQRKITMESIFEAEESFIPLEKTMLEEGFNLSLQDHVVSLTATESEAISLDLGKSGSNEFEIQRRNLNPQQLNAIKKSFSSQPDDSKKRNFAKMIARQLKYDSIPEPDLIKYVEKVIEPVDNEQLTELIDQVLVIAKNFKAKIDQLLHDYRKKKFVEWLDTDIICCLPDYKFPRTCIVRSKMLGAAKGLYVDEGDVNTFEERVITKIAGLDNVLYWHRNPERGNGFGINGFINHYPDFIVKFKSGKIALIETKGDDRDNQDSKDKIELGDFWSRQSDFSNFKYYMVFDTKRVEKAFTIAELLERLKLL